MNYQNQIVLFFVLAAVYRETAADFPSFRVLAPEFVCPNTEDAVIEKPDNTVITIKTDSPDLLLYWTVRWTYLERPSQRFTLLLWKTVRALEDKLNAPQPEPFVYIIDNAELLQGVEYIFNVTAFNSDDNNSTKTFAIDNIKGDPTLVIEGRSEKFSVLLLGGETLYADMQYAVQAEVTTCSPVQDYYFRWTVRSSSWSLSSEDLDMAGARLEIPRYTLQAGLLYYVSCSLYRNNGEFVTQTGLPLQVLFRGLAVRLNFDVLMVTLRSSFDVIAVVENHDYYENSVKFEWSCSFEDKPCEGFESADNETLTFSTGLIHLGRYEIFVMVSIADQEASSNATVIVTEHTLPIIQVKPIKRTVNQHTTINLVANASGVAPSCTLSWYFVDKENLPTPDICEDCQSHGIELPGSITVTSLEEVFLNELTDFSNETEWRQVEAQIPAAAGRARFVATCGCSLTFSCETQGEVYADINFQLNESPIVADVMISPETGTAMETVFRVSTLAASDPDLPLRYSFYCDLGDASLLMASYLQHFATEVFLPYVDETGTKIWVEVCDSLGACSSSNTKKVQLLKGEGRTMETLLTTIRGLLARCETMQLRTLVKSAVKTFINANQQDVLSTFRKKMTKILTEYEDCSSKSNIYHEILQ